MRPRIDIDALRALQAIVTYGGVTRAAEHLSLSQSAVSHKIKRLEDSIDCSLLNRKPGAPLLTEAGTRLHGFANRILSLHDEAVLSLSKRTLTGSIRLGMTEDITGSGLANILSRFARLFPDVHVRTHVAQSLVLQNQLERGEIDLSVMQLFANDVRPTDIVLFRDHLCWAKAIDLDLNFDQPIPFLSYDENCFYRKWMLEHVASQKFQFQTVLECSSNNGILAGIAAGLGISIISHRHIGENVEEITDLLSQPPEIAYVVRKSTKSNSKAVKALSQEIDREAAEFIHLEAA